MSTPNFTDLFAGHLRRSPLSPTELAAQLGLRQTTMLYHIAKGRGSWNAERLREFADAVRLDPAQTEELVEAGAIFAALRAPAAEEGVRYLLKKVERMEAELTTLRQQGLDLNPELADLRQQLATAQAELANLRGLLSQLSQGPGNRGTPLIGPSRNG